MPTGVWPGDGSVIREKKEANDLLAGDDSINEQSLALSWNIPRASLSTIRKSRLREHWHWKYGPSKNHGDVRITREGIEELKKWVLPPDRPQPVPPPEKVLENVPLSEGGVIPEDPDLAIVNRVPPNPRILLCRDAKGQRVKIRVRSNADFRKGMKISLGVQCVRGEDSASGAEPVRVYVFKGKLPKAYGRW